MRLLSRRCEVCGTRLGPFDRACKWCSAVDEGAARLSRWQPRVGEVAVRFEIRKPKRTLGEGLIVERGQAAVLSLAGGAGATLQPGPYHFDGLVLKDLGALGPAGHMCLAFVATSDIDLRFNVHDLLTKDHLPVAGLGLLTVRVARPALFVASVVKTRARFTERDLCQALAEPMTDAMADVIGRLSAFELDTALQTKQKLAAILEHQLAPTLDAHGLEFVALRAANFIQEGVAQERKALGDALLAERQLEIMRRRVATREKMSELESKLALAEARSEQQIADLHRSLESRAMDQELVRHQMREKMELEHQLELAQLRSQLPPRARTAAEPPAVPHHLRRAAQAYAQSVRTHAPSDGERQNLA